MLLTMQILQAQTNDSLVKRVKNMNNIIIYDFKSKDPPIITPSRYGGYTVLKIANINRLLYKVSISTRNTEYISEPPALLNKILGLSSNDLSDVSMQVPIKGFNKLDDSNSKKPSTIERELGKYEFKINEHYSKLILAKSKGDDLVMLAQTNGVTFKEINDRRLEITKDSSFASTEIFTRQLLQFNSKVRLYLDIYNSDSSKLNRNASIKSQYLDVLSMRDQVAKSNYREYIKYIGILNRDLSVENNFSVVSYPVKNEQDAIVFDVEISRRNPVNESENQPLTPFGLDERQFSVEARIRGGWKVDFSTGAFLSTGLQDREYIIEDMQNSSTISTITEIKNRDSGQISYGALVHLSRRGSKNFKLGFTSGFSLNSTEISDGIAFLGGSAMFGSPPLVVFSVGISAAKVAYLDGRYSLNTPIANSIIKNRTQLTKEITRPGLFVGITYNLTRKDKKQ